MAITLRNTKGAPLTHDELDANFTELQKFSDSASIQNLIDSDYVRARQTTNFLDSNDFDTLFAASDIDNLSDGTTNKFATSTNVEAIVDSNYVSARVGGNAVNNAISSFLGGQVNTNITPSTSLLHDLGDSAYRWNDIWLAGSTLHLGDTSLSVDEGGLITEEKFVVTAGNEPSSSPGEGIPTIFSNPSYDSALQIKGRFGGELVTRGNYTLIGLPDANLKDSANDPNPRDNAGYAVLYEGSTVIWEGNQAENEGYKQDFMGFGRGLALSDSFAFINAKRETAGEVDTVYTFALNDPYNVIDSIPAPSGQLGSTFGQQMQSAGRYLVVSEFRYDSNYGDAENEVIDVGRAYLYKASATGASDYSTPYHIFKNPNTDSRYAQDSAKYNWFARDCSVSSNGNVVLGASGVGNTLTFTGQGKVYRYLPYNADIPGATEYDYAISDSINGAEHIPDPAAFAGFGRTVEINNKKDIVVGSTEDDYGRSSEGAVYVFDSTNTLSYRLANPFPNTGYGARFGLDIDINETFAAVCSRFYIDSDAADTSSSAGKGRVYIYNIATGERLKELENPNNFGDSVGDEFGAGVMLEDDGTLLVGAIGEDVDSAGQDAGVVYRWGAASNAVDSANFNGIVSANWFNDSGVSIVIDGRYGGTRDKLTSLNLDDQFSTPASKIFVSSVDGPTTRTSVDSSGGNFRQTITIPLKTTNPQSRDRWSGRITDVNGNNGSNGLEGTFATNTHVTTTPIDFVTALNKHFYILDAASNNPQKIYQITMSSDNDISTAAANGSVSISGDDNAALAVDPDAKYVYTIAKVLL